jgi:Glycosyltransferase family 10 (fucosyltransferase) C-term
MRELLVKLFSPWHLQDLIYEGVRFSPNVQLEEADGALWEYAIPSNFLSYDGPKGWYFWEPSWHSIHRSREIKVLRGLQRPDLLLWYGNEDPAYRVPHITRVGGLDFANNRDRIDRAVAIVSNFGGYSLRQRWSARLRNRLILHSRVDLYGRKDSWQRYAQLLPIPKFGPPRNYRGEAKWANSWMSDQHVCFISRYKVTICLENSIEPYYFTEKFINAVRAGCVPIYYAHPTIADGILRGARWIDPKDYDFDANTAIDRALSADIDEFQSANNQWLESDEVQKTFFDGVWATLGRIFQRKFNERV